MSIYNKKKFTLFVFGCLLVIACIFCMSNTAIMSPKAVEASAVNWGLSFQTKGAAPIGNKDSAYLKQFDAYFLGDTTKNTIYLTFDCGYENGNTKEILAALTKHGVKATFFAVGNFIRDNPDLIKEIVADGNTVGNHTFTHPDMSAISSLESFQTELQKNEDAYKAVMGEDMPKFYRPPQGKFSEDNLKMAQSLGYKTIFWSLAYVDWYQDDQPNPKEAVDLLCSRIHPGAIVLLHNTSSTNGKILDTLLTKFEEMGYTFGTLDELA